MSSLVVIDQDTKHSAEKKLRGFDLTPYCTNFWYAGMSVSIGFRVRPMPKAMGGKYGSDGYEYEATTSGQVGEREPQWAATDITDGSVIWQRRDLSSASLFKTVTNPGAIEWLAPDAMTISGQVAIVSSVIQVAAFHEGGIDDEVHRVVTRVPFSDGTIEDFGRDWTITPLGIDE